MRVPGALALPSKDNRLIVTHEFHSFFPAIGATTSKLLLASFPGSHEWAEKKEPGTHCLRMLSSPRILGNLEISVKYDPLH